MEPVQYTGGCSVPRGITSVLWRLLSTVGMASVLWGITTVHQGDNISTVEDTSVLWRVFSTVERYLQYCGG